MNSIFKIKRHCDYTIIGNNIITDCNLSWAARGLLIYLLSKPSHWEVRIQDLINSSKREGKTKVQSLLKELRENKYVRLTRGRTIDLNGNQKFGSYYEVTDIPDNFSDYPSNHA